MKEKTKLRIIVTPLVTWYKEHGRTLPWRKNKNPYSIWLSEIMLQQTKIEAVKKYYERFIHEIPDIATLAKIEEDKLLKLWEGLGYYNRARNLRKAAIIIQEKYNGIMPNTYEELLSLPGIGEYTAGAIASIAFGQKVPAVDGNVLRVVMRFLGSVEDVLLVDTKKRVANILKEIMPQEAGIFNEAIMELGEKICIPNGVPLCQKCPLQGSCEAKKKNLVSEIPIRNNKKTRKKQEKTVLVIECNGKIAIRKRPSKGLLSGLYEFPNIDNFVKEQEIDNFLKVWNLKRKNIEKLESYCHVFSHIEWYMIGYFVRVENVNTSFYWVEKQKLIDTYPIPTAFLQYSKIASKLKSE